MRQVVAALALCLSAAVLRAEDPAPSDEILPGKWKPTIAPNSHPDAQWFRSAALGIFQHWGIVSGSEYASPEGWEMLKPAFVNEANRRGYPWELCTIAHGGSWHWSEKADEHGPSAAALLIQLARVRARGGNFLVNIAPRPDGEMPHWFYPLCEQFAAWMKTGAEAIYDIDVTGPFPYPDRCAQPVTVKGNAWYVFATRPGPLTVKDVARPARVTLLRTGGAVQFDHADRQLTIRIQKDQLAELPDVAKVVWSQT